MARKKSGKTAAPKRRKGKKSLAPETNQPFETDTKRRIGQHAGTGRAPLMKK